MRTMLRNVVLMAVAMSGCGETQEVLDLGDNSPPEGLGENLADYAGSWEGYAEAYAFSDGSDRVRLRIDSSGNGRLEFGDSPAPVPAVPAVDEPELPAASSHRAVPGLGYEISGGTVEDQRIRLRVPLRQVIEPWCARFEPVRQDPAPLPGEPYYACFDAQNEQTDACVYGGLPTQPGLLTQCGPAACTTLCTCSADECGALPLSAQSGDTLDGALGRGGKELVGTLHLFDERVTIRLTRR